MRPGKFFSFIFRKLIDDWFALSPPSSSLSLLLFAEREVALVAVGKNVRDCSSLAGTETGIWS
jgi:hypothetical protein